MSDPAHCDRPIAVYMAFSGDGGVERMVTQLLQGFVNKGRNVDLVLARARGGFIDQVPAEVNIVRLGTDHTYTSLPALCRYLRRVRPQSLLVAKHRAGIVAVLASRLCAYHGRLVLRLGTTVSAALEVKLAGSVFLVCFDALVLPGCRPDRCRFRGCQAGRFADNRLT